MRLDKFLVPLLDEMARRKDTSRTAVIQHALGGVLFRYAYEDSEYKIFFMGVFREEYIRKNNEIAVNLGIDPANMPEPDMSDLEARITSVGQRLEEHG